MASTVKVYNLYEGNPKIAEHFHVSEFKSKDGSQIVILSEKLLDVLEKVRVNYGKPLHVTSGYRTTAHNKTIGGVAGSTHCQGLAADIIVEGIAPNVVADYVETLMPKSGGIGRYTTFTHVDVRNKKSRWTNGKE